MKMILRIDGTLQADLTGGHNDTRSIDPGTRGTYFFDALASRRSTYIVP